MQNFSNGDYDAEIDNALSFDRSVVLPNTRPTLASYNKPDNWRERNRIGLEKVKEHLQNSINLESHGYSMGIYLNHNSGGYYHDTLMDNEEPIVWHHETILDEYWDQLEEAVQQDIAPDIQEVSIDNVEITKESMSKLAAIFSTTNSCTFVNFNNANLCEVGIVSLLELVDVSSKLQCFFLRHNRIDNIDLASCLSRSLKSHACINGGSQDFVSNPPIKYLSLENNRLNDDDAVLISQALKRNTNLETINLCSNNLTSNIHWCEGTTQFCVFDGSSLNAISESNCKE